jgi:hypothetical protein
MENELISQHTEKRIIADLKLIIEKGEPGKVFLKDYIKYEENSCMDFAMIYEASDDLRYFIEEERIKGVDIEIEQDNIAVVRFNY